MSSHMQLLGFGIMDQFQVLEHSLVNIFLESSLRLSNVLNGEFFILVDTPSGRRVAGSDKLCSDFSRGHLNSSPGDARVRLLDGDVPVAETPLGNDAGIDVFAPREPRLSQLGENFPESSTTLKRRSMDESAEDCGGNKRARVERPETRMPAPQLEGLKTEFEIDDDDIEILDYDVAAGGGNDYFSTPHQNGLGPFRNIPHPQEFPPPLPPPPPQMESSEADFLFIRDYLNENAKVACIRPRLANGMDFAKQSADMRILGSIMYDVGKLISNRVKIPDKSHPLTKGFFSKSYEVFWSGVPALEAAARKYAPEDGRRLSLKAHLRAQCYHSFKNIVDKMSRRVSF